MMHNERQRHFPLGSRVRLADLSHNPYPTYQNLQQEEPVSWIAELGLWFVTRRADILAILLENTTFSVASPDSLLEDTFGRTMLSTDGSIQRRLRQPWNVPFAPARVRERMADAIASQAHALIDALSAAGQADLKTGFADQLALRTVTSMLGLPIHDFAIFRGWFTDIGEALGNFTHDSRIRARGQRAAAAFGAYAAGHLTRLRREPDSSVLSQLLASADPLGDEEILAAARVIIFGGLETTAAMLANTIWAVLTHPAAREAVQRQPALLEQAMEESLRWEAPVQSCTRHVTRPTVVQGVELSAGDTVQCMVGAANRDLEHFPHPHAFDLWRENASDHLSFALGKHFCLGAALARLEGEIGLRALFERLPDLRLDPAHPSQPKGHEFRSPPTLWARWGA
jgi:cytochrome P450